MTCAECLSTLATGSLRDLTSDSPVLAHCATCPDCARVTTMLRTREYDAANLLNALPPMSNPIAIAEASAVAAKRRNLGRIAVMMTGTALAATIFLAAQFTVIPAMNRDEARHASRLITEIIPLSCLSPEQASEMINPFIRANGSVYFIPTSGIAAITVRATRDEVAKAREVIERFESDENAACNTGRATGGGQTDLRPAPGDVAPALAGDQPVSGGDNAVLAGKKAAGVAKKTVRGK